MKKAFTLSEFFILIVAIAIIGALVLPPVLKYVEKSHNVKDLKHFYGVSDVALKKFLIHAKKDYLSETGLFPPIKANALPEFDEKERDNKVCKDLIEKYHMGAKCCDNSTLQPCYHNQKVFSWNKTFLEAPDKMKDAYKFYTLDGMFAYLRPYTYINNLYDMDTLGDYVVGVLMVDINGVKRPNIAGKDVFYYHVANNGELVPFGLFETKSTVEQYSRWNYTCNQKESLGTGCAGRIFEEDWKIKYY